jgi:hypothetical protein
MARAVEVFKNNGTEVEKLKAQLKGGEAKKAGYGASCGRF